MESKIIFWAFARQFATRGVHHQKGAVDAASVVAFLYDIYSNPTKNNGVLCATFAFLDAGAALPRKSDTDGAASLPWKTSALTRGGRAVMGAGRRGCWWFSLGSGWRLTLQELSFGSAAEIVDGETGDQADCGEVCFGFGDGDDFGAGKAGLAEGVVKGISIKYTTTSPV
jgi:hypothetical protein